MEEKLKFNYLILGYTVSNYSPDSIARAGGGSVGCNAFNSMPTAEIHFSFHVTKIWPTALV